MLAGMTIPGQKYSVKQDIEPPLGKDAKGALVYGVQGMQPPGTVAGIRMRSESGSFRRGGAVTSHVADFVGGGNVGQCPTAKSAAARPRRPATRPKVYEVQP